MLTTRGWALAAGNLALLIAGRLFGIRELFELGLGLATLVVAACVLVRRSSHETRLSRAVDPVEVYPGTIVRVEVTIQAGSRRTPPLLFVEELPVDLAEGVPGTVIKTVKARGAGSAAGPLTRAGSPPPDQARRIGRRSIAFPIGAIEAHETHQLAYRVVPTKRGRFEIGPGSTIVTDPFGLARSPDRPLAKSFLLVYPAYEQLLHMGAATPASLEGNPRPIAPTGSGDDFFTMREYQSGDDIKKIHWRTSARQGRMMVRQEDRPAEPRAMVLLDDRRSAHARRGDGADSFEAAICSAASLIHLFSSQGLAVGLALASRAGAGAGSAPTARGLPNAAARGSGLGVIERFAKGPDHERDIMQRLAVMTPSSSGDLSAGIATLLEPRRGATYLAVVTTEIDPAWELHTAAGARAEYGLPLVVIRHLRYTYQGLSGDALREAAAAAAGGAAAVERAGGTIVDVEAGQTLKPSWDARFGARVRFRPPSAIPSAAAAGASPFASTS